MSVHFFTSTSIYNNSDIIHHIMLPRVTNERYCNIFFFIFGSFRLWGKWIDPPVVLKQIKTKPKKITSKNVFTVTRKINEKRDLHLITYFFIAMFLWSPTHQHSSGARIKGPIGPHNFYSYTFFLDIKIGWLKSIHLRTNFS